MSVVVSFEGSTIDFGDVRTLGGGGGGGGCGWWTPSLREA